MNKNDICEKLIERRPNDFKSKAACRRAVDGVFDLIQKEVADGGTVCISGFGTFLSRERAARKARNPRTGEAVSVEARRVPAWKSGKQFKENVR